MKISIRDHLKRNAVPAIRRATGSRGSSTIKSLQVLNLKGSITISVASTATRSKGSIKGPTATATSVMWTPTLTSSAPSAALNATAKAHGIRPSSITARPVTLSSGDTALPNARIAIETGYTGEQRRHVSVVTSASIRQLRTIWPTDTAGTAPDAIRHHLLHGFLTIQKQPEAQGAPIAI